MIKIRHSRLPFVIALLIVALGFGGYYMFRSVTLPQVQVTKVVDYKKWLTTTSGQAPKSYSTSKRHPKVLKSHKVSRHSKSGKAKYAHHGKKPHGKAKLAKGSKHHGKAKLAKGNRGKAKIKRASHKR